MSKNGFSADLSGKTAVVTGASRGIGQAIAEILAENGAHVIGLQRTAGTSTGTGIETISVDLEDQEGLQRIATSIAAEHQVDILVNNAGINIRHPFEDFPLEDFDKVMRVNLRALVITSQIFGRPMIQRGHGKILNIASMLCFFGGFTAAAYGASKGAVGQFTKSIANEWAPHGVNVNAIAPGFHGTDMNVALMNNETRNRQILERIPAGRWGTADDVAGAALFLVSSAADYMHGTVMPVDGGYLSR